LRTSIFCCLASACLIRDVKTSPWRRPRAETGGCQWSGRSSTLARPITGDYQSWAWIIGARYVYKC